MWCVAPLEMNEGNYLGGGQGYNRPTGCSAERVPHATFLMVKTGKKQEITDKRVNKERSFYTSYNTDDVSWYGIGVTRNTSETRSDGVLEDTRRRFSEQYYNHWRSKLRTQTLSSVLPRFLVLQTHHCCYGYSHLSFILLS